MSKAVKEMITQELATFLKGTTSCLVVGCEGMTVTEATEMRQALRERGLGLKVVKNSLAHRALTRVGMESVGTLLTGPSAFLTGDGGAIEAAKAFVELRKKQRALVLRGAYVEGSVLSSDEAKGLAAIPPREVLLAQILAGIQAPLSGLAGALSGVSRQLAMLMKAVAEGKDASAGTDSGES